MQSVGPYGTFDMGGNVFEFNEAIIPEIFSWNRGSRGGAAVSEPGRFGLSASERSWANTGGSSDSQGFRVVLVPEPSSSALLAMAAVGLLLWVKRRKTG